MNMNQKGFANIVLVVVIVAIIAIGGYFVFVKKPAVSPPEPPQSTSFNFVFRYGVGAKNELDTSGKTYTKDMVMDLPIKVKMFLTDEEMNEIYQKMLEINFFDYPDEFSVPAPIWGSIGMVTPCDSYYFKVFDKSRIKELSWADCITNKNKRADKLRELIRYIENIIESKKEYKELPTPRAGYI